MRDKGPLAWARGRGQGTSRVGEGQRTACMLSHAGPKNATEGPMRFPAGPGQRRWRSGPDATRTASGSIGRATRWAASESAAHSGGPDRRDPAGALRLCRRAASTPAPPTTLLETRRPAGLANAFGVGHAAAPIWLGRIVTRLATAPPSSPAAQYSRHHDGIAAAAAPQWPHSRSTGVALQHRPGRAASAYAAAHWPQPLCIRRAATIIRTAGAHLPHGRVAHPPPAAARQIGPRYFGSTAAASYRPRCHSAASRCTPTRPHPNAT